jgi:threonylcarbamoyladenosine tRNA methylthiotransferase CDKAL1
LKMIKETEPDIVNSSRFSPRPGTLASNSKSIAQEILTQRSEILHSIIKNIAKKRNSRWLNWKGDAIIDEMENVKLKGRNQYYKSIIIKNLNENKLPDSKGNSNYNENFSKPQGDLYSLRLKNHNDNPFLGKTIMVEVTGYSNHTLEGIQIT